MSSPKANFDNIYAMYSPTAYVKHLIGELNYQLPFQTMEALKLYIERLYPETPPETAIDATIVGSSHGLDVVALKYEMTAQDILARWGNEATVRQPFPQIESRYEMTLIDIEPAPLRFAADVKLADKSFVADLSAPLAAPLEQHLSEMTDIIIATGVISYLGIEGLERMLEAAFVKGKAKLLAFSALKFLDNNGFLEVCQRHGLTVRKIVHAPHRSYKSDAEKQRVKALLKRLGILSEEDESGLMGYVFVAYKESKD